MLLPCAVDYAPGDAGTRSDATLAVAGSRMTTRKWNGSLQLHAVSDDANGACFFPARKAGLTLRNTAEQQKRWKAFGDSNRLVEVEMKTGAAAIKWCVDMEFAVDLSAHVWGASL